MKKLILNLTSPRSPRREGNSSEEPQKSPRNHSKEHLMSLQQALKSEIKVGMEVYIANEEELKLLRTLMFGNKGLTFNNNDISKRVTARLEKKDSENFSNEKVRELKNRIEELEIEVDLIQQEKLNCKEALKNKEKELLIKTEQSEKQTINLQREFLKKHNELKEAETENKRSKQANFELKKQIHEINEEHEREINRFKQISLDKEREFEESHQRLKDECNVRYNSLEFKYKDQIIEREKKEKELNDMILKNESLNILIQENETKIKEKELKYQETMILIAQKEKKEEELKQVISDLQRKLESQDYNQAHELQIKYIDQISKLEQKNIELSNEYQASLQKHNLEVEKLLYQIKELESIKEQQNQQIIEKENELKKKSESTKEPDEVISLRTELIKISEKKDDEIDIKMNEFESKFEKSTQSLLEVMKVFNTVKESFKKEKETFKEIKEYQKTKKDNDMILKLQKDNLELEKKILEIQKAKNDLKTENNKNESFFNAILNKIQQNDKKLAIIDFTDKNLNDENVIQIVQALKNNTNVKKLILQDNKDIKGKYTNEICDLIIHNKILEEIHFLGCNIENQYVKQMIQVLPKNLHLIQFTAGNNETDQDIEEIERICDRNFELKNK